MFLFPLQNLAREGLLDCNTLMAEYMYHNLAFSHRREVFLLNCNTWCFLVRFLHWSLNKMSDRWHCQILLRERRFFSCDSNFIEVCPWGFSWQWVSIGSGNGLGVEQATSHYLNQRLNSLLYICVSRSQCVWVTKHMLGWNSSNGVYHLAANVRTIMPVPSHPVHVTAPHLTLGASTTQLSKELQCVKMGTSLVVPAEVTRVTFPVKFGKCILYIHVVGKCRIQFQKHCKLECNV